MNMKKFSLNKNNFLPSVESVIRWLIANNYPQLDISKPIRGFLQHLEVIQRTKGLPGLVSYLKDLRMVYWSFLCGNPISVRGIRMTSKGIPKVLAWTLDYPNHEVQVVRLVNTILVSTRSFNLGKKVSISSIIDDPKEFRSKELLKPINFSMYVSSFWKELGFRRGPRISVPSGLAFTAFHMTSKTGPYSMNKANALWVSMVEVMALPVSLVESIKILGGEVLALRIQTLRDNYELLRKVLDILPFWKGEPVTLRRICSFPDKELKIRIIALLDYWSQTSLRPLHSWLFRILKRIPQDCTFDQDSFKDTLGSSGVYYSVDLSAATDRFPIWLIAQVLEGYLPKSYVTAWKDVMVGYSFDYNKDSINYRVGNPMGAYSSWASFALAHHFIVYVACWKAGRPWSKCQYSLLGDDIIIRDDEVAKEYMDLIAGLGVEYSIPKTHISPHFFEFAKRIFYKGVEVSPFPISALKESTKRFYLFSELMRQQSNRGWPFIFGTTEAIESFYGRLLSMRSSLRKKLAIKAGHSDTITKVIGGSIEPGIALTTIASELSTPLSPALSDKEALSLLSNIAVELFAESNPVNYKGRKPSVGLGNLAIELVTRITGVDFDDPMVAFQVIESLPVLGAYARVEETYITLSKKASSYSDWPLLLKTMALPWDDKIFYTRAENLVVTAQSKVLSLLQQRFEVLRQFPQLRESSFGLPSPSLKVESLYDWLYILFYTTFVIFVIYTWYVGGGGTSSIDLMADDICSSEVGCVISWSLIFISLLLLVFVGCDGLWLVEFLNQLPV
jgi:hypothetical protein